MATETHLPENVGEKEHLDDKAGVGKAFSKWRCPLNSGALVRQGQNYGINEYGEEDMNGSFRKLIEK